LLNIVKIAAQASDSTSVLFQWLWLWLKATMQGLPSSSSMEAIIYFNSSLAYWSRAI